MERIEVKKLFAAPPADGAQVTVCGWARTVRDSKNIGFLELSDGSCFKNLQVVFEAAKLENYKEVAKAGVGTSVRVRGRVVLTPGAKQPLEVNADAVELLDVCPAEYPLQKKRHSVEFLRTMPHLRPRTNTFAAAFRVRSAAAYAIHKFFQEQGFVYVHTPLITGSDCEGAGEMFRVTTLDPADPPRTGDGKVDFSQDFFGRATNLTVSGQLEGEAMAMAFGKIYTFGPTFRAENSNTPRHAAEFWMIEPEMAFADLADYMDNAEAMVKYVIGYVLEQCPDEMAFFNQFFDKGLLERLTALVNAEFVRLSYTEAVKLLEQHNDAFQYIGGMGHRPADRARALFDRADLQKARVRDRLPQRDQELLYAPERGRQNRGRRRHAGARRGRADRGQPARGAAGGAGSPHGRAGPRRRRLRVVPGSAPLWQRKARGLRPGL